MKLNTNEVKRVLLDILITMAPIILMIVLWYLPLLYVPNTITGTVQIIKNKTTDEPYQIVLRGEGDNILGDKDFVIWRNFDTAQKIICEKKNITDGDKVVFNHKGIIQYKINE